MGLGSGVGRIEIEDEIELYMGPISRPGKGPADGLDRGLKEGVDGGL